LLFVKLQFAPVSGLLSHAVCTDSGWFFPVVIDAQLDNSQTESTAKLNKRVLRMVMGSVLFIRLFFITADRA